MNVKHRVTVVTTEKKNKEFFIGPAHTAAEGGCCGLICSLSCDIHSLGLISQPVVAPATQAFLKELGRLLPYGQGRVRFIYVLVHAFT